MGKWLAADSGGEQLSGRPIYMSEVVESVVILNNRLHVQQ
jgi:hypothetical protein